MKENLSLDKAVELGARALCRLAGDPENTKFEGRPMWRSYEPEARAVLEAVGWLEAGNGAEHDGEGLEEKP